MRIEHIALQVPAPIEMAAWYVEHLGLTVVRRERRPALPLPVGPGRGLW